MIKRGPFLSLVLAGSLWAQATASAADPTVTANPPADKVVVSVNGRQITQDALQQALARKARQTFYHGQVAPDKLTELRDKLIDEMVVDILLADEVERRAIAADEQEVEKRLQSYEEQYKNSDSWAEMRDTVVPQLRERMVLNTRKKKLEEATRDVPPPTEAQIKHFYDKNLAAFTEPSRDRVSVIVLSVDPSSTKQVWDEAQAEAGRIRQRLLNGEPFADLAKLHSSDESAAEGGDLGYLHRGMLATEAQEAVDKMNPGDLSEPVLILKGYVLVKLHDRSAERLRPLADVRDRAIELYRREEGEKRWTAYVAKLRSSAKIWVDASLGGPKASPKPR